jgi:hypothetical protein
MSIRKRLAVGAAAAALGMALGVTVLSPVIAGAQESTTSTTAAGGEATPDIVGDEGRVARVRERLEDLVTAGTITSAQADAVAEHLAQFAPEHGGRFLRRGHVIIGLDAAAEAIGVELPVLLESLREGQTIAEVAAANGVDTQDVVDALVAVHQARLDELVAEGSITAAEASERAAAALERITAFVNGEIGFGRGFPHGLPDGEPPASEEA